MPVYLCLGMIPSIERDTTPLKTAEHLVLNCIVIALRFSLNSTQDDRIIIETPRMTMASAPFDIGQYR